ncbi:hypothetical protein KSP40_PGU021714 [Platanthera guangdongensis]|uniref:Uncharacterized protein n=1 Tax=Platanthera guangdongensis TaxID=2320717 RepID=A0ABR2N502_9ASPA
MDLPPEPDTGIVLPDADRTPLSRSSSPSPPLASSARTSSCEPRRPHRDSPPPIPPSPIAEEKEIRGMIERKKPPLIHFPGIKKRRWAPYSAGGYWSSPSSLSPSSPSDVELKLLQQQQGPILLKEILGRQKKLRRLPHIFSKVLELPCHADADVSVAEDAGCFRFVAVVAGWSRGVCARAIQIYPGVMKVVIRDSDVAMMPDPTTICPLTTSSSIDGGSGCHQRPDRCGHHGIFRWRTQRYCSEVCGS